VADVGEEKSLGDDDVGGVLVGGGVARAFVGVPLTTNMGITALLLVVPLLLLSSPLLVVTPVTRNRTFSYCRRFKPGGGSLDRRVNYRRVPQPRWVGARRSAKGGEGSRRETGVRGGIPRPSCLSRARVGCACSRGLQASTWEGASGLTRAPSRPSPRGQPSIRGPWSFLL
jgi:hypothetical protein